MKHFYIALFTLLFYSSIQSQSTFNEYFGLNLHPEQGSSFTATKNDGTIMFGYSSGNVHIIQLDKFGNKVFSKAFFCKFSLSSTQGAITNDSGFICIANAHDQQQGKSAGTIIFKLNKKGNVVWSKNFYSIDFSSVTSTKCFVDTANNFVSEFEGEAYPIILKLDNDGNLLWANAFVPQPDNLFHTFYYCYSLITHNEDIYFGGYADVPELDNSDSKGFVVELNKNGEKVFYKKFQKHRSSNYYDGESAKIDYLYFDNDLYAYGSSLQSYGYFKLSDAGKTIIYSFSPSLYQTQQFFRKNKSARKYFPNYYPDGGFAAVDQFHIEKYDFLGRICPDYKTIVDSSQFTGEDHIAVWNEICSMKPILLSGKDIFISDSTFSGDSVVCKGEANEKDNSVTVNNSSSDKNKSAFIYPNPATKFIVFQFQSTKNQSAEIEIYTTTGKRLEDEKIHLSIGDNTNTINVSNLPPGVYFLKLITQTEKQNFKFIKQ